MSLLSQSGLKAAQAGPSARELELEALAESLAVQKPPLKAGHLVSVESLGKITHITLNIPCRIKRFIRWICDDLGGISWMSIRIEERICVGERHRDTLKRPYIEMRSGRALLQVLEIPSDGALAFSADGFASIHHLVHSR